MLFIELLAATGAGITLAAVLEGVSRAEFWRRARAVEAALETMTEAEIRQAIADDQLHERIVAIIEATRKTLPVDVDNDNCPF